MKLYNEILIKEEKEEKKDKKGFLLKLFLSLKYIFYTVLNIFIFSLAFVGLICILDRSTRNLLLRIFVLAYRELLIYFK